MFDIPIINPDSDTPLAGAMSIRKPDFSKKYANIHYQSEATGEFGTVVIRENTTLEDVMAQYCRMFPKEAALFKKEVELDNKMLLTSKGMSANKSMMAMGKIPEIIMTACKFLFGEDYWADKKNTIEFFRMNTKLQVGDHNYGVRDKGEPKDV